MHVRSSRLLIGALVATLGSGPSISAAADLVGDPTSTAPAVEVHGFVSQGAIWTTDNNYLVKSKEGSVDFTELGVNLTTHLTDKLRVGLQLVANRLGTTGNFSTKADWFYLDYRFKDWLGIRAGRVKLPFGLYNDTSDIDAARVPVLLPQSVYPIADRDFLLAQTGLEVYGYVDLRGAGALDYRVYGGTIYIPLPAPTPGPLQVTSFTTRYVAGGRLLWETPIDGLRAGASVQALRLDAGLLLDRSSATPPLPAEPVTLKVTALLWVGSLEYVAHDWQFAVEYSRWHVGATHTSDPTAYPPAPPSDSERAYAMVNYRVRRWLQPGAYYSRLVAVVDEGQRTMGARDAGATQNDFAGTLRFDINPFWLVKVEGHLMRGTADLKSGLNDGAALDSLVRTWGAFFLKTTAYF
jgi:hypothetical protein